MTDDLAQVKAYASEGIEYPPEATDFMKQFEVEACRQNFDASRQKYDFYYRGNKLPHNSFNKMSTECITLSKDQMIAVHKYHAERILDHIQVQIDRTQQRLSTENRGQDVHVVLVGGVAKEPFLMNTDGHPLVAVGCILSLGQPNIGQDFIIREAYGVPMFEQSNARKPKARKEAKGESGTATQSRGRMEWMVMVGEESTPRSRIFEWRSSFKNDDGTPRTRDPRNDPSIYPVIVRQDIFSTTNSVLGSQQGVMFGDHPAEIKKLYTCEISLSKEECDHISKLGPRCGFYRNPKNGVWMFLVDVRTTLQWLDVRASWLAEISKTGKFEDGKGIDGGDVWSKEIKYATIEHHGHEAAELDSDDDTVMTEK